MDKGNTIPPVLYLQHQFTHIKFINSMYNCPIVCRLIKSHEQRDKHLRSHLTSQKYRTEFTQKDTVYQATTTYIGCYIGKEARNILEILSRRNYNGWLYLQKPTSTLTNIINITNLRCNKNKLLCKRRLDSNHQIIRACSIT